MAAFAGMYDRKPPLRSLSLVETGSRGLSPKLKPLYRKSRLMSIAITEWVRAPTDIRSTRPPDLSAL